MTGLGIGTPVAGRPRIFERYHRETDVGDRRIAWLGLGPFTCHSIVEQHRGRTWATSAPGGGSPFHVRLPRVASAACA